MPKKFKPVLVVSIVLIACFIQLLIWPIIDPYIWLIFYPAVIFCALIDGMRGTIISVLMLIVLIPYLFMEPRFSFSISDPHDYIGLGIFLIAGIIFSIIARRVTHLEQGIKKKNEDLMRLNEELWKSEQKLKYHLENSPIAAVEWDHNFIITQWSKAAENIFGWSSDETVGKAMAEINMVYNEDIPVVNAVVGRLKSGKELNIISSNRNITKTGKIIECIWYNSVLLDKNGKMSSVLSFVDDVTELNNNIHALEESEKKYRELVKYAPAGIYEIDFRTQKFTSVNDAMAMMSGYSSEELLSMNVLDILDEESRVAFSERVKNLLKGRQQPENVVYRIRKKNGESLHAFLNIKFKTENGIVTGASVVGYDITERVRIETALRESEERLHFALETIHAGAWELDLVNFSAQRSIEHARIFGYQDLLEEWTFEKFTSHIVTEDREKVEEDFKRSLEYKEDLNFECRIIRVDGEIRWIWVSGRHIPGDKKIHDRLSGIVQDITYRKQSEAILRETQEKLEIALENANIGIWEWNLTQDIVNVDSRAEKMLCLKPGGFLEYGSFERLINEEDVFHMRKAVGTTLDQREPFETIIRIKSSSGKTRYINLKGLVSEQGRKGEDTWITGVCFDITEMKLGTEKLISRLNEDLLRSNNDLQQFAYVASHDLQEPLRMVSSFTQLLQQRYGDKLGEDAREYIQYAVDGSKRMYELLNGLLSYSRVNTRGKDFEEVNMNFVVERAMANLKLMIEEKNAVINCCELPSVIADDNQMIQLMQNLLENSLKFSRDKPEITISAEKNNNFHIICVKDEGIGIDSRYFDKIFRIFQKLHPREEYPGTGIGLAICKRIIDRHNGTIWVESEPGQGSRFCFSLPVRTL